MKYKLITLPLIIILAIISLSAGEEQNQLLMRNYEISYDNSCDIKPYRLDTLKIDSTKIELKRLHTKNLKLQTQLKKDSTGSFKDFLHKLAWRESRGNWTVVNRFGYIGKYQFGQAALTELNYQVDIDSFKVNPLIFPEHIQDSLAIELVKLNKRRIKPFIKRYAGKTINSIKVTESGILAASHLVGGGNVRKWLRSKGKNCTLDGNGVSIEEYLVLFSKFNLNT